jgi:hypothetical protein
MGDIFTLTDKLERAMLKDTGFQISETELRVMIDEGIVDAFFAAKLRVLRSHRFAPRASANRTT